MSKKTTENCPLCGQFFVWTVREIKRGPGICRWRVSDHVGTHYVRVKGKRVKRLHRSTVTEEV